MNNKVLKIGAFAALLIVVIIIAARRRNITVPTVGGSYTMPSFTESQQDLLASNASPLLTMAEKKNRRQCAVACLQDFPTSADDALACIRLC